MGEEGIASVRRVAALVLTLSLWGCSQAPPPTSGPVDLLTGVDAVWAGGESPSIAGLLVADPAFGTTINGRPVMWPLGFTGQRLPNGEVAVLNQKGKVVATTGRVYALSEAPTPSEAERLHAYAVAGDAYPHDLIDCAAPDPGLPTGYAEQTCRRLLSR